MTTTARPWATSDVRRLVVGDALATLLLVASAVESARVSALGDGIVWINLAVVALVALAASHGLFLIIGRKRVGSRRRALLTDARPRTRVVPTVAGRHQQGWVWIAGTRRAHRPNCVLVVGKHATTATDSLIRAEQLRRCEVCAS